MIALAASVVLALYLIVPSFIFRFVFGIFVPLRIFVRSRSEEFYRAVVTALIPLLLAWGFAWTVPFLRSYPFEVQGMDETRRADYKLVAASFYSEQVFVNHRDEFWTAFTRSSRRQARLLTWYYVLIASEALMFGYSVRKYGTWKDNKYFSKFADKVLLPHVSEWHVLLTPLVFAERKATVRVDILSTEGTLYKGVVSNHFLDRDGMLSGLILTEPRRFDRRTYLKEKDWGSKPKPDDFWKDIPSAKLYIPADKISNINLNYEPEVPSAEAVSRLVKEKTGTHAVISVTFTKSASSPRPRL